MPSLRSSKAKRGGGPRWLASSGRGTRHHEGTSLAELLVVLALAGLVGAHAWQALASMRDARAGREAARGLVADLRRAAQEARRLQRGVAVEFAVAGGGALRVLADGNGNGVTTSDIASGVDAALEPWRSAFREGRATLAVERDLPDTDGGGTIAAGSSPVRLGIQPRVNFTARGTGSAGSLYVAGRDGRAYAIRVLGTTQRIRLLCLSRTGAWEGC